MERYTLSDQDRQKSIETRKKKSLSPMISKTIRILPETWSKLEEYAEISRSGGTRYTTQDVLRGVLEDFCSDRGYAGTMEKRTIHAIIAMLEKEFGVKVSIRTDSVSR